MIDYQLLDLLAYNQDVEIADDLMIKNSALNIAMNSGNK